MRVKFIHWYNMLLTALISLLGLSSCNKSDESKEEMPCEYGCPVTAFKVDGTVTDTHGSPIEGIQVSVLMQKTPSADPQPLQTTTTLADGTFTTEMMDMTSVEVISSAMKVKFEDIDGAAHGGHFDSKTVTAAELKRQQTKEGDGKWFHGEYEYSGDITLSPLLDY